MAKNLSALRAVTPKSEAKENKHAKKANAFDMTRAEFSVFCSNAMARFAMYKGCTSKPTPRLEKARLRSSVFKVFDNDDVFLIARIVTLFNMVAVQHNNAFKTQLAMYDERYSSATAIENVKEVDCISLAERYEKL